MRRKLFRRATERVSGFEMKEAKVRWLGHRLHADIAVRVDPKLSVADVTTMTNALKEELLERIPGLA